MYMILMVIQPRNGLSGSVKRNKYPAVVKEQQRRRWIKHLRDLLDRPIDSCITPAEKYLEIHMYTVECRARKI